MKTYSINQAIVDVADCLRVSDANDETMIRTALNDTLDAMSKSGFSVRHDYNQERAVKRVKLLLRALR